MFLENIRQPRDVWTYIRKKAQSLKAELNEIGGEFWQTVGPSNPKMFEPYEKEWVDPLASVEREQKDVRKLIETLMKSKDASLTETTEVTKCNCHSHYVERIAIMETSTTTPKYPSVTTEQIGFSTSKRPTISTEASFRSSSTLDQFSTLAAETTSNAASNSTFNSTTTTATTNTTSTTPTTTVATNTTSTTLTTTTTT